MQISRKLIDYSADMVAKVSVGRFRSFLRGEKLTDTVEFVIKTPTKTLTWGQRTGELASFTLKKVGHYAKNVVETGMSAVLWLVPKPIYRWLEGKLLYAGMGMRQLVGDLAHLKREFPEKGILKNIQEIRFESQKGVNNLGWYHPAQKGKPTILLSMGNAWSIEGMVSYEPFMKQGYGFLAYEYPGYGKTAGKACEEALYKSVDAASQFLEKQGAQRGEQVLYGVSVGGAVAVHQAAKGGYKALIVESSLTHFSDVVKGQVEKFVPSWLFPLHKRVVSQLDSLAKISKVNCPILFMHGSHDPLISSGCSERLHRASGSPSNELHLIPVGDHNLGRALTYEYMDPFLEKIAK